MKTDIQTKNTQTKNAYDKNDVFIVIAAYNESNSISNVVSSLRNAGYKNIVVVDDGSKDNTFSILNTLPVFALRHVINIGQGAALKTGIDFAVKNNANYIVTFDADGQHRTEDLEAIISPVAKKQCEVALGSRFLGKKTKMPIFRYLVLKTGVIIQWMFYGLLLSDAHNGFRCFSNYAAKKIQITSNRMEHASQIVEEIKRNRLKYKEIPVIINYSEETLKKGHGGFLQGLGVFWKMLWHKLK
jgi:glycosyltransferase involved in cell wall biosynthesis